MLYINPPLFRVSGDYSNNPSYGLETTVKLEWSDTPVNPGLLLVKDSDQYSDESCRYNCFVSGYIGMASSNFGFILWRVSKAGSSSRGLHRRY